MKNTFLYESYRLRFAGCYKAASRLLNDGKNMPLYNLQWCHLGSLVISETSSASSQWENILTGGALLSIWFIWRRPHFCRSVFLTYSLTYILVLAVPCTNQQYFQLISFPVHKDYSAGAPAGMRTFGRSVNPISINAAKLTMKTNLPKLLDLLIFCIIH